MKTKLVHVRLDPAVIAVYSRTARARRISFDELVTEEVKPFLEGERRQMSNRRLTDSEIDPGRASSEADSSVEPSSVMAARSAQTGQTSLLAETSVQHTSHVRRIFFPPVTVSF